MAAVRWYFKVLDKSYLQNMTGKFNTNNTDDGYLTTIKLLIKAYRNSVNDPDNKECTPLYYLVHILGDAFAAKDEQTLQKAKNVAELLMRAGAKTTSVNARLSPLALAKEKGVVHILEEIELNIISNQNQPSQAKVPDQKNEAKKINKGRSKRKKAVKHSSDKKEFSNMDIVFPVLDEKKSDELGLFALARNRLNLVDKISADRLVAPFASAYQINNKERIIAEINDALLKCREINSDKLSKNDIKSFMEECLSIGQQKVSIGLFCCAKRKTVYSLYFDVDEFNRKIQSLAHPNLVDRRISFPLDP